MSGNYMLLFNWYMYINSSIITVNQFNFPDTCGGTVNIQLNFNRLLPYKSTHFPSGLDYPMICNWNFTVLSQLYSFNSSSIWQCISIRWYTEIVVVL
jgi:hypothetical protein